MTRREWYLHYELTVAIEHRMVSYKLFLSHGLLHLASFGDLHTIFTTTHHSKGFALYLRSQESRVKLPFKS